MLAKLTFIVIIQIWAYGCSDEGKLASFGQAMADDKSVIEKSSMPQKENAVQLAEEDAKVYYSANDNYPIMTVTPALICNDVKYLNEEGALLQGTKACSKKRLAQSENIKPENIKKGVVIADVVGTLQDGSSLANCTSSAQIDCVTTDTVKSALMTQVADKIISGQIVAGVSGTATLPTPDKVLSGQVYGPPSATLSGTLTLPPAAAVRISAGAYGAGGIAVAPLLPTCSNDGDAACVVVGPTFAALLKTGAQNKILAGQTLGGVSGTITLPADGKVLTGTSFGVAGSGSIGTLVLPSASNVRSGSSAYGEPGSPLTPSFVADFPSVANVVSSDTVNSAAGTLLNCTANAAVDCVATATYKSADLTNLAAGNIKAGVTIAGQAGDYPSLTNPLTGATAATDLTSFGPAVATGSYEFFDGAGTRYAAIIADPGTLLPGTSNQTIAAANTMYRQAVVAGDADLVPSNLKLSINIFGAVGTIAGAPANCAADGTDSCLVDGTNFKAMALSGAASKILSGASLGAVAGNVTLPAAGKVLSGTSYGVSGTGLSGTLTLPLAANVKSGTAAYGDAAAQSTPAYVPDFPSVANVKNNDTVNSAAGTLADCTGGNQTGCVATSVYKTMDLSAATVMTDLASASFNTTIATAADFEFWDSTGARHQLAGDADLTATNILTGTTLFGAVGSATPAPANCAANGAQSCIVSASYYAGAACAANASNCFVPTYAVTTQPLKAISYDAIDAGKASIRDSLTLGGLAGTLADCTTDGTIGCFAANATHAALLKASAGDKILSGNTIGSVAGNVTLPAVNKVLASTSFGVGGTALTGTLTLPLAANVKTGTAAYGDAASQLSPAYSPDFPSVGNVLSPDTVDGATGTLTLPAVGKVLAATTYGLAASQLTGTLTLPLAADVKSGTAAYGDAAAQRTPAYSPDFPSVANVLASDTVNGSNGTLTLPAVGKVLTATSYGVAGSGSTGTLTLPLAADVKTGSGLYGDAAAQLTPAYSPDFPLASNVHTSDTVNGATGTLTLPAAGKVLTATSYGQGGNGSSGSLTLPAASNVKTGTAAYGETGSLLTPSYTPDYPLAANVWETDTTNGVTGTLLSCTAGNQSACVSTATYKSIDLSAASASTDLSAANFNATIATAANFEFWDSAGGRHQVAGDADLAAANVLTGTTIFGVAGSAAALPANCSSNGSQSCVATGSYYAASACSANGSNCFLPSFVTSSQPLKAISYDAIDAGKASIRTSLTLSGIAGTLADCSAGNTSGCVSTPTYKSMDLSAAGTDTGLTAANFQTRIATAANSEFWDASGARHSIAGDADLSVGKVKSGVVIHGVTGQYPSASYPLANNTAATDLTLFTTQLTTDGSFEFFDSAGAKYTGSGDSDLVNANIKNAVAIENLSLTGSYTASLTCPTGWIKVPGDSAYGTGDFCVMKYEAKDVSTVATSQASLTPWVLIPQTASITRCRALGTGYDLISNPQWMTIGANVAGINGNWSGGTVGSGSLFAGHNDDSPSSACAAPSNDTDFYVETNCTAVSSGDTAEQRRTLTLSNSNVIWDLSGNVWEWVNYINRGDKPGATAAYYEYTAVTGTTTTALKDLVPTNAVKAFWSDTWNSTKYVGRFYPGTNGSGGALERGGGWGNGLSVGVFAALMNSTPSGGSNTSSGLRCVLGGPSP